MAYLSKGMLNEALADVNKSIEAQSNYPKSYETRAKVYSQMGKTAEAARDMEKVKALTSGG
jgi:Tfp pilus assembly protein PilF